MDRNQLMTWLSGHPEAISGNPGEFLDRCERTVRRHARETAWRSARNYVEHRMHDWESEWDFYSELFGWQKGDAMDMGEMGTYQMYNRGAHPLGGMFKKPPEMPVTAWLFYVRVPDINGAVEKIKELGGTVMNGPMEVPGGDMVAQCLDPQGAAFAVHATARG